MNVRRKVGTALAILAVTGLGGFAVGCGDDSSSDEAQKAIDKLNKQAEDLQNQAQEAIDKANKQAEDLQDEAKKQLDKVDASEAQKQIDEAQKQMDEIQKQIEGANP
jgi:uncharacterized protein HemX